MNLISIITPSYNQAPYLEQTIQSVLGQDYPRLEYIVVDGASTDNSFEIIKKYNDRLAYWISEKDSGQAEAINKGFARAGGEILAWLNSDDYYLPNTISAVVKCFEENPDVVMVYGDMLAVDGKGRTINVLNYKPSSLDSACSARPDSTCAASLGGGAVSCPSEKSCEGFRVWARSVPCAGLGKETASFGGNNLRRGKTLNCLRKSLRCALSPRRRSARTCLRRLVPRL